MKEVVRKILNGDAGAVVQQLRILTALVGDLGLVPSTQTSGSHLPATLVSVDLMSFSDL